MGGVGAKASAYEEGDTDIKQDLLEVRRTLTSELDHIQVTGRYHLTPRRLEDDYTLESKELGNGYNGAVQLASSKTNGGHFAVKPFKLRSLTATQRKELRNEVELFLSMDHPHIARLVDVYECEDHLKLVMECLEGGELFDRIREMKLFSEELAADSMWQMLLAINYIHGKHIVHRDIKLENFLYDTEARDYLKLIDFGFSRVHKATMQKMQISCGTLPYMAPEVVAQVGYTKACDLWSMGVVLFILLLGYMPFPSETNQDGHDRTVNLIKRGKYTVKPEKWSRLSVVAKDFLTQLLERDPSARISAEAALGHPFIQLRHSDGEAPLCVDQSIVESLCEYSKASNFRRACMTMMAWSLTSKERAEVRNAFEEMDSDRSGVLTLYEVKLVFEKHMQLTDVEVQRIFDALDSDSNEEVNYTDFLAAMMSSKIAMHDDVIRAAFKRFDTDSSAFITLDDLKTVLGESYRGEDIEDMLKEADLRKDGRISLPEFFEYLRGDASELHQEAIEAIIEHHQQRQSLPEANAQKSKSCSIT